MENVIESISNYFSDEFKSQLANSLDETQAGISKALSAIIPLTLQRLTSVSENGAEGQNEVARITSDAAQYYSTSPNLSKLHNEERGSDLPGKIFGNDNHNITRNIANFSGIRNASAEHLITMALPVIAGKLGQYFNDNHLSGSGLSAYLSTKKTEISNSLPSDYQSLAKSSADLKGENNSHVHVGKKKKMFPTWVMFVVIILVFLLLIYFSRGCKSPDGPTVALKYISHSFLS